MKKYRIITTDGSEIIVKCDSHSVPTVLHCFYNDNAELLLCTPITSTVMLICDDVERTA